MIQQAQRVSPAESGEHTSDVPSTPAPLAPPPSAPPSPAPSPETLSPSAQREFLWKVLQRFDHYVGTMNTKAALIIALNTFMLGGAVMKWADISAAFSSTPMIRALAMAVLAIVALASVVSIWMSLLAVTPITTSSGGPGEYHSLVFFDHVARFNSAEPYIRQVHVMSDTQVRDDCAMQVHAVARVTLAKAAWTKRATATLLAIELPLIAVLIVLKLFAAGYVLLSAGGA